MKIYQLIDTDGDLLGLLKVEVPLTGSYDERSELQTNMDSSVKAICQNEFQTDFDGADELIGSIANKLDDLGYYAERFYVEEIVLV